MSRRHYRNPPVHEVVLSLAFSDSLDSQSLRELPELVTERFGGPEEREEIEFRAGVGPLDRQADFRRTFAGWDFKAEDLSWILRLQPQRITFHFVRTTTWPTGPYLGWEKLGKEGVETLQLLSEGYGSLNLRRAGLRYLNRVAIPSDSRWDEWFTFPLPEPSPVRLLHSFDVQQTWAEVEGYEGLSANLRVAKIKIPDEDLAQAHVGVLLDIDVFNLLVEDAPIFRDLPHWYSRAHEAENEIFESCITEELRRTFEPEDSQ